MTNKEYGDWSAFATNIDTGMSIRDYFAAAALNGMLANTHCSTEPKYFAKKAVEAADALINELNQKDEDKI